MPHQVLYEHYGTGDDHFLSFRVILETYTNRISLRFRTRHEAASGLVGTPAEMISYLDSRALDGPPWDQGAPREARRRIRPLIADNELAEETFTGR